MAVKKILFISTCLLVALVANQNSLCAQDTQGSLTDIFTVLQDTQSTNGVIELYQNPSLNVLIDKHKRINQGKLKGYRIQLYRGTGQSARDEASAASQKFMTHFTEYNYNLIYVIYEAPYFKLRIGDYRTKNEAFEFLYQLKKYFPNAYIVNSRINFPKLDEVAEHCPQAENE